LALQLAQQSLNSYPDGVWFVDLAPVQDAQRVTLIAANVVGVREVPVTPLIGTLTQHLRTQQTLMILDNCEHLISSAADLVDALLDGCSFLKVIATSRESLGVASERTFGLRSLGMPAGMDIAALQASDAVRLFVDRARMADPALKLDAVNGPVIADICRRVDGIPLAIELAAARVKMLKVEEIRTRLNDRFRLLTGGSRALPRHQTLLATIQWSHDHLTAQEQNLFRRLSVFAGGWTLAAATAVNVEDADELRVLDTLTQLMDKSLISVDRMSSGDSRYTMLDTVRQYALDRLGESDEGDQIRAAHLTFFLAMAESAAKELRGPDQGIWLSRLDTEHENMLAAHGWCGQVAGRVQEGLELVANLVNYWRYRGLLELGERMTAEALARESASTPTLARSRALAANSVLKFVMGHYDESRLCDEESLSIARALGDKAQIVLVLAHLGMVCNAQGDLVQSREHLNGCLGVAEELGGPWLRRVRHDMAELLRSEGDPDAAEPMYEQLLDQDREQGHRLGMAEDLANLAMVAVHRGASERARALLREALAIGDQVDNKMHVLSVLDICGSIAALTHEWVCAARFHGAARKLMEQIHFRREPVDDAVILPRIAVVRDALGEADFAAALSGGRALSHEQALAEMRAWLKTAENTVGSGT
jgi:predicted ATPase